MLADIHDIDHDEDDDDHDDDEEEDCSDAVLCGEERWGAPLHSVVYFVQQSSLVVAGFRQRLMSVSSVV